MKMQTMECSNCGAEARIERGDYRFKESGLRNVTLHDIEIARCPKCGNEDPIIPSLNNLMKSLALAVIRKPYRMRGEELRFLRKYLHMTGEEFSHLIHVDKTTLSKWENDDDPIGEQSDLLIRAVAMVLGEGLQEKQSDSVRMFARIGKAKKNPRIEINAKTMEFQYA